MKATLVLLPLLGITYMLFFVNPGEDEVSRVVFIYFNSFLESFQVPAFSLSLTTLALGEPICTYKSEDSSGRGLEGWGAGATWAGQTPLTSDSPLPLRASSCLCSTVF